MKRLLLILIFSGSLDGISQVVDTSQLRNFNFDKWGVIVTDATRSIPIGRSIAIHSDTPPHTDTTRSVLLVSGRPPSFTHAVYGYCVRKNGACVGHLDSRQRLFKLPVRVWGCDYNNYLKQGKDGE